ncbi:hypothetical protein PMAYCL1PPCAC_07983, partial [Pristionchus mayeri]
TMNTVYLLALVGVSVVLAEEAPSILGGLPTSINGNLGLVGGGYGDVYGGKVKEGVYGMGGRVGGNLGLVGSAGLGRKKRQALGASAHAAASASGPNALSMAGAAAGTGSFGLFPGVPANPATAAPAATTKPCPGKRRR